MMSKILLPFISMPSFALLHTFFLSHPLDLYAVFKMSSVFLSIIMHLMLTEQCGYVKFIIQMVVCIKIACSIAACAETVLQFSRGLMCPCVEPDGPFCSHLGNLAFGPYAPSPFISNKNLAHRSV